MLSAKRQGAFVCFLTSVATPSEDGLSAGMIMTVLLWRCQIKGRDF